jgi:hypothetical protein
MAMRDVTGLMNAYRECARHVWNVNFSGRDNIGGSLDSFGRVRDILFNALVVDELFYEEKADGGDIPPPAIRVVPQPRTLILIKRLSRPGEASYWDEEKDLVVGADEITLAFLNYFDFSQIPVMDFSYYRCRILKFPKRAEYEGREALIAVRDAKVYHDEEEDDNEGTRNGKDRSTL